MKKIILSILLIFGVFNLSFANDIINSKSYSEEKISNQETDEQIPTDEEIEQAIKNGDLVISVKTNGTMGAITITSNNNTNSFNFYDKYIKITKKTFFKSMLDSIKIQYTKLKTSKEKEIFKNTMYLQLLSEIGSVVIVAQNQSSYSGIIGVVYFNGEIKSQSSSNLDYGVITLNVDIAKYIIESLDK